jgi:hypothetical protein
MKITEIKTASLQALQVAAGKAMLSQGEGANFSRMLENRLTAINKEMDKRKFNEYISKDDSWFSEGHLQGWFMGQYHGKSRSEIKFNLEVNHDNSLEIENCTEEIGRELTDNEEIRLLKRFYKAIYNNIEFRNGIAIGYYDSLNNLNVN